MSKLNKTPLRTCVVCRQKKDKSELIKVVRVGENDFLIAKDNKTFGRGAYVCNSPDCVCKAVKKRAFDRSFKQKLPDELYTLLSKTIE